MSSPSKSPSSKDLRNLVKSDSKRVDNNLKSQICDFKHNKNLVQIEKKVSDKKRKIELDAKIDNLVIGENENEKINFVDTSSMKKINRSKDMDKSKGKNL